MRTPLGVGSLVLLHDQARPKSSERYKLPALSATAIDEPFAAIQPVSTIPSVHAGISGEGFLQDAVAVAVLNGNPGSGRNSSAPAVDRLVLACSEIHGECG